MNRYEKYKPTNIEWIGEIPEHWKTKRIKYEINYEKGKNPKEQTSIEKGKPYLSMEYLRGNPKQTFYIEDYENYLNVKDNEILLLWDGSNAGEFIKSKEGVLSSTMAVINVHSNNLNYSWYFFKTLERILRESTIGMGIPHVNSQELKNEVFIIPSLEEQAEIANFLDVKTAQIDKLIANKKQLIELLKEERTAIINKTVSGEGKNWIKKKLKYVAKMQGGFAFKSDDFVQDGIQLIRIGNLYQNEFSLDRQSIYLSEEYLKKYPDWVVYDGDILISMTGTLGKRDYGFAILIFDTGKKYFLNQRVSKVFFKEKDVLKEFGLLILRSTKYLDQLFLLPTGTKQGNFSNEQVLSIPIEYPRNLEEQQTIIKEIAIIERKFEDTLQKIEQEIQLMQEYKIALISEVVTGKQKVI